MHIVDNRRVVDRSRSVYICGVVDVGDVDGFVDRCVRDVHIPEVALADVIRRRINLPIAERNPAHGAAHRASPTESKRNPHAKMSSPKESHQRRSIVRLHDGPAIASAHVNRHRSGTPTPPPANKSPTSIVEGRESPGSIVHPGVTPWLNPSPMACVIGRPTGRHLPWVPDRAVSRRLFPSTVIVQIFISDHGWRKITGGSQMRLVVIALVTPVVELIGSGRNLDVIGQLIGAAKISRCFPGSR